MASLDIITTDNKKAGAVDLSATVFEAAVRPHLVQAEVRRQLAARRAGTHSTKNRALVSGGGAKPYKQKGTGRARQGTTRAPQFAGGGIAFGPVPRNYSHKLNKKTRAAALRSALSWQFEQSGIVVLESLDSDGYNTKRMAGILKEVGLGGKTVLLVIDEANATVEGSARNIPGVDVIRAEGLNVYDVLRHKGIVFTKASLAVIEARLGDRASDQPSDQPADAKEA
jgi:large subunit ribosomal protein L4